MQTFEASASSNAVGGDSKPPENVPPPSMLQSPPVEEDVEQGGDHEACKRDRSSSVESVDSLGRIKRRRTGGRQSDGSDEDNTDLNSWETSPTNGNRRSNGRLSGSRSRSRSTGSGGDAERAKTPLNGDMPAPLRANKAEDDEPEAGATIPAPLPSIVPDTRAHVKILADAPPSVLDLAPPPPRRRRRHDPSAFPPTAPGPSPQSLPSHTPSLSTGLSLGTPASVAPPDREDACAEPRGLGETPPSVLPRGRATSETRSVSALEEEPAWHRKGEEEGLKEEEEEEEESLMFETEAEREEREMAERRARRAQMLARFACGAGDKKGDPGVQELGGARSGPLSPSGVAPKSSSSGPGGAAGGVSTAPVASRETGPEALAQNTKRTDEKEGGEEGLRAHLERVYREREERLGGAGELEEEEGEEGEGGWDGEGREGGLEGRAAAAALAEAGGVVKHEEEGAEGGGGGGGEAHPGAVGEAGSESRREPEDALDIFSVESSARTSCAGRGGERGRTSRALGWLVFSSRRFPAESPSGPCSRTRVPRCFSYGFPRLMDARACVRKTSEDIWLTHPSCPPPPPTSSQSRASPAPCYTRRAGQED